MYAASATMADATPAMNEVPMGAALLLPPEEPLEPEPEEGFLRSWVSLGT